MTIQFTLNDAMLFILCAAGIAAVILLLPTLLNIKKMTKIIRVQMEENQQPLEDTIKTIPVIIDNMGQISGTVRETTDYIHSKVTPGIAPYLHIIEEVLQIISANVSSGRWNLPHKSNRKRR